MDFKKCACIAKVLGEETRAKIFCMLKQGRLCACKILEKFKITQPTLSYHMKMLVECGLVNVEKEGIWSYYSIDKKLAKEFCHFVCDEKCEL